LDEEERSTAQLLLEQQQAQLKAQLAENQRLMGTVKRKRLVTPNDRRMLSDLVSQSNKGDI